LLARTGRGAAVVRGVYVFPSVKGHRRRKEIAAPSTRKLNEVLRDLMDVIDQGAFATAEAKGTCRWCEFAAACHAEDPAAAPNDEATRAKRKVENPKNTALAAYVRLRSHE
jgi:dTDP-4-dehydrorhamnose reductase